MQISLAVVLHCFIEVWTQLNEYSGNLYLFCHLMSANLKYTLGYWQSKIFSLVACRLDHILLETTGLANPAPLASVLWLDDQLESAVKLDSIITVSLISSVPFDYKSSNFMRDIDIILFLSSLDYS